MGVAAYNAECRKIVMRYSKEWEVSPIETYVLDTPHLDHRKWLLEWDDGLTSRMTIKPFILGLWRVCGEFL